MAAQSETTEEYLDTMPGIWRRASLSFRSSFLCEIRKFNKRKLCNSILSFSEQSLREPNESEEIDIVRGKPFSTGSDNANRILLRFNQFIKGTSIILHVTSEKLEIVGDVLNVDILSFWKVLLLVAVRASNFTISTVTRYRISVIWDTFFSCTTKGFTRLWISVIWGSSWRPSKDEIVDLVGIQTHCICPAFYRATLFDRKQLRLRRVWHCQWHSQALVKLSLLQCQRTWHAHPVEMC